MYKIQAYSPKTRKYTVIGKARSLEAISVDWTVLGSSGFRYAARLVNPAGVVVRKRAALK